MRNRFDLNLGRGEEFTLETEQDLTWLREGNKFTIILPVVTPASICTQVVQISRFLHHESDGSSWLEINVSLLVDKETDAEDIIKAPEALGLYGWQRI